MRQKDISVVRNKIWMYTVSVFENVCTFTMLQCGAKEKISNSTAHIDALFILSIAPV